MQFVSVNGVTLHYQTIGDPKEKPTIVFSNSLGTDFRIWRDLIVRLAGDYAIVAYDKRGHGLSDIGTSPYNIQDHVDDLAALLDHLNVSDCVICGLSVGGLIAQGLTFSRPDLVRALILCDTGHKIGTEALWKSRIRDLEAAGISAISDAILERWFAEPYRASDNPDFAGYRNMLERTPKSGYIGTCHAIRDADFTDKVGSIDLPVLCVVGDCDGATPPELVEDMARRIPGAEFAIIEGAGHLPCIEQPEKLHQLVSRFLTKALS